MDKKLEQKLDSVLDGLDRAVGYLSLLEVGEKSLPETIAECYEVTADIQPKGIIAPTFEGQRVSWGWLFVKNTGKTRNCKIGINGNADGGFTLEPGQSRTINFKDLKIQYIRYLGIGGDTTIQFIPLRPKGNYG